jgi:hypothetical protein
MNGPLKTKRGPWLVADQLRPLTLKANARAEARSEESHFKLLSKEFRRDGFNRVREQSANKQADVCCPSVRFPRDVDGRTAVSKM